MATIVNTSSSNKSTATSGAQFTNGGADALQTLIKQLLGGGTPEQKAEAAQRLEEINADRQTRANYTKQAAFSDAEGAVNEQRRKTLEQLLPSINKAAEGAGASASSMRALLLQNAERDAAEAAASLGLKASVDYGQINSALSGTLSNLTQQTNPVTKALLEAIGISKVSTSQSTGASTGNNGSTSTGAATNQSVANSDPWGSAALYAKNASTPIDRYQGMFATSGQGSKATDYNYDQPSTGAAAASMAGWSNYTF